MCVRPGTHGYLSLVSVEQIFCCVDRNPDHLLCLIQDAAVTPEMVEEEFAKYGALLNGKSGVTISVHKFGGNKNVHVS